MKLMSSTSILRYPMAFTMALLSTGKQVTNIAVEAATFAAFNSTETLKDAVYVYCSDEANWTSNALYATYGPIEQWDVSLITDMRGLFYYMGTCNPSIGEWDTSRVTDFYYMFYGADSFNQPIGNWDVSSGTYFVSKSSFGLIFLCYIYSNCIHVYNH